MVIISGQIAYKTPNMQFLIIGAKYYGSLFNLEHFKKKRKKVLAKIDQFKDFWSKN